MMEDNKSKLPGAIAIGTSCLALLDKVLDISKKYKIGPEVDWVVLTVSGLVLLYLYLRRLQNASLSHLAKPELLERVATKDADLFGRERDLEKLAEACRASPQIFLMGESGVGKTALLKIGLRSKLRDDAELHPVFVDTLEGKPGGEPRAVARAIMDSLGRGPGVLVGQPGDAAIGEIVRQTNADLNKTVLLIIDSFEVYVRSHRRSLIPESTQTWITKDELVRDRPFWREVSGLLANGALKLLIASRSDESAGITTTFALADDLKVFDIERLTTGAFHSKAESLVGQGAIAMPENGWNTLESRLAEDLSPDGWILPIQMTVAFRGLVRLRPLTVRAYLSFGGLPGLEGAVVRSQVAAASRNVGLTEEDIIEVLLLLFDRKNGEATPRTVSEMCTLLRSPHGRENVRYSADAVAVVLLRLDGVNIVRRRVTPGDPQERWTLYHDYLHRGVLSAERRLNKSAAMFRAQYAAHVGNQGGPIQFWSTLVPPWLLVVLVYKRMRQSFHFGSASAYAALSTVRIVPYLAVFLTPLILVDFGISLPGAVVLRHEFIRAGVALPRTLYRAPGTNESISAALSSIRNELNKRIDSGWARTAQDSFPGQDYWSQAQEISAELRSGHVTPEELGQLRNRTLLMLNKDAQRVGQDGRSYGWATDATLTFPRAEPLLWLGSALAMSLQHGVDNPTKAQITNDLAYIFELCDIYFDSNTGGWFRFAGRDSQAPSSYVSALALFMLIDLHTAQVSGTVGGLPVDQVLRRTLAWLRENFVQGKGMAGWKEVPSQGIYQVSPQLTVFIYSQLLRARQSVKDLPDDVVLQPVILAHIRAYLTSLETVKADPTERGVAVPLTIPDGKQQRYEWLVGVLWLPWEIELTRSGLQLTDVFKWTSTDERTLRYHLNDLLDNDLPNYMRDAVSDYTFKLSELLYALEPFEDARLGQPAPAQATAQKK